MYHTILWHRPKGLTYYPTDSTCPAMFIVALFEIARNWKQYKCPSTDELIMKMWYI